MAKTVNPQIDIFANIETARKAFDKVQSAHLLKTKNGFDYFVDKSKTALSEWPNLYILIDEKDSPKEVLNAIGLRIKQYIDSKKITVLAVCEDSGSMKYGSFAVAEPWHELHIICDDMNLLPGVERYSVAYVEGIDRIVNELKENGIIYLEW